LTGINGCAAHDECPAAAFAGIALEYGTYPIEQVLQSFRAEHWLHNHPDAPVEQRQEIKHHFATCSTSMRRLEADGLRAGA
jgi:hypothetical protein